MITALRRKAVLARNYAVYLQHAFWAVNARGRFPLNPSADFVISVASYPARIHLVPAVFESLARQTVKPRCAYIVLSEEDYPGERVPKALAKLVDRGVEIVWTRNNPYAVKKLVPIWGRHKDCAVLTFDDDIIYGPRVVEGLKTRAAGKGKCVVGYWGKALYQKRGELGMWFRVHGGPSESTPSGEIYLLGGSGVWYSANALHPNVTDLEGIRSIVPGRGSDIWFWAAAHAAGASHLWVPAGARSRMWIPIPQTHRTKPLESPGDEILDQRFQMAIDFFGIREKLLRELPDYG